MNLKQLEAFVRVAEAGSFSKAAKGLFLTQPTVSAHISTLEKELNARLFVRNTKEVSLSEDGKLLYRYARQMIELEQEIAGLFEKSAKAEATCVTIAASTIPAQYILPEILVKFRERYPNEQFKITESDSANVAEQVADHLVDIGFNGAVMEKKHCEYVPFYRDELTVVMPNTERYRRIRDTRKDLTWIHKEPVIMREEGSGTRKEAEKQLKMAGVDVGELNIVANVENPETIKRSVESGIGITILSRLAVKAELESEKMLEFPLGDEARGRDLNMVYNKNYQLSSSAEKFIKIVKELYPLAKENMK